MGYCTFELRYNGLYRDIGLGGWPGRSQGGHDTAGIVRSRACDTATTATTIRPRKDTTRPATHAGVWQPARMACSLG